MTAPTLSVLDKFQQSISDVHIHTVAIPPIRSEWRFFRANGVVGNVDVGNQISFSILPPSNTTIVDRRFFLQLTIKVTPSAGRSAGGTFANTFDFVPMGALRAFPVNSLINQSNISINGGGGFITPTSEILYPLKRYLNFNEEEAFFNSPTMPDPIFDLTLNKPFTNTFAGGAAGTVKIPGNAAVVQTNNASSVFIGCASNVAANDIDTASAIGNFFEARNIARNLQQEPRGFFPYTPTAIATAGGAQVTHTYKVTENLLNGFLADAEEKRGIVNVSKLDIQINLEQKIRAWSTWLPLGTTGAAGADATTATDTLDPTVEIIDAVMFVHFITPSITTVPGNMITGFQQYVMNKFTTPAVAALASLNSVNFTNITMNTVPSFLYIYVRPTTSAYECRRGEFCAKITKLSINLGTSFGHLSQMDEHTLYMLCKDNGLKQDSFVDFTRYTGSVICIDAAKDLGLVPGQVRYFPLDFTVDFTNISTVYAGAFDVCLLSVIPGTASISPDLCTSFLGFSAQDEGNSTRDSTIAETKLVPDISKGTGFNKHGGKFTFGSFLKGAKQGLAIAAPVLQGIAGMTGNATLGKIASVADRGNQLLNAEHGSGYKRRRGLGSGMMYG